MKKDSVCNIKTQDEDGVKRPVRVYDRNNDASDALGLSFAAHKSLKYLLIDHYADLNKIDKLKAYFMCISDEISYRRLHDDEVTVKAFVLRNFAKIYNQELKDDDEKHIDYNVLSHDIIGKAKAHSSEEKEDREKFLRRLGAYVNFDLDKTFRELNADEKFLVCLQAMQSALVDIHKDDLTNVVSFLEKARDDVVKLIRSNFNSPGEA